MQLTSPRSVEPVLCSFSLICSSPTRATAFAFENLVQGGVLDVGHVAWEVVDLDLGSYRHGSGAEGAVHLLVRLLNGFHRLAPDVALHPDVGWDVVHNLAALRDDGMDPDGVLLPEGLPLGVDAHEAEHRGVQRVYPLVGRPAGVGLQPDVADHLAHEAVVAASDAELTRNLRVRVAAYAQVDVGQRPEADELLLAAEELEQPLLP